MTSSDASSPHDTSSSQPDDNASDADAPHGDAGAEKQYSADEPTGREREQYERFRRDFDHLSFENQATFLVEAGLKTMARGIETAGRALADELGSILRRTERSTKGSPEASRTDAPGSTSDGPGPAEPETSQRRTSK